VRNFIFNLITRLVELEDSFTLCAQEIEFAALMLLSGMVLILQGLILCRQPVDSFPAQR
jgi:hypothetical protein